MGPSLPGLLVLASVLGASLGLEIIGEPKEHVYEKKDACFLFFDCPYALDAAENDSLTVKWYYGKHLAPIYEWTWGYAPQAYGEFADKINAKYASYPGDSYNEYRGIYLIQPTPHFTGHYECQVTTEYDTQSYSHELFIWAKPELSVSVERTGAGDDFDSLVMNTAVSGMYPEPSEWRMWWYPPGQESGVKFDRVETEWQEGYYDASYRVEVPRWEMENGASYEFGFSVSIDRVGETFSQSASYTHSGATSLGAASLLIALALALVNRA